MVVLGSEWPRNCWMTSSGASFTAMLVPTVWRMGGGGLGLGFAATREENVSLDEAPEVGRDRDVAYLVSFAEHPQHHGVVAGVLEVGELQAYDLDLAQTAAGHDREHYVVAVVVRPGRVEHALELVLRQDVVGRVLAHARALGEEAQCLGDDARGAGHEREDQKPPQH